MHRDVFFSLISEAIILQPVAAALILLALKLLQGEQEMYYIEHACQSK